jgi:hypothetical protein
MKHFINLPRPFKHMTQEFLTAQEIAPVFGVSPNWLLRRTRPQVAGADCVPHVRVGKFIRFRIGDLRAWFERHQAGAEVAL